MSASALDGAAVYHTYSCYQRGPEAFNGACELLDRTPGGRAEDELPLPFSWIRRHDQYDDVSASGAAEPRVPTRFAYGRRSRGQRTGERMCNTSVLAPSPMRPRPV
jgi:hypothetical protein